MKKLHKDEVLAQFPVGTKIKVKDDYSGYVVSVGGTGMIKMYAVQIASDLWVNPKTVTKVLDD